MLYPYMGNMMKQINQKTLYYYMSFFDHRNLLLFFIHQMPISAYSINIRETTTFLSCKTIVYIRKVLLTYLLFVSFTSNIWHITRVLSERVFRGTKNKFLFIFTYNSKNNWRDISNVWCEIQLWFTKILMTQTLLHWFYFIYFFESREVFKTNKKIIFCYSLCSWVIDYIN